MYTVLPQALHGGIIVSYRHNFLVFVEPACGERSCYTFSSVYVHCTCVRALCICASFRICLGHNLYIYAWISKEFGTVFRDKEKCYLKHSRYVERQGHI